MTRAANIIKPQPLKDNDTIVFLGDSITQSALLDHGYITLTAIRIKKQYPDLDITLIGAGINGHRVPHCQKRLHRDVLQKKPSIVLIYIGVNDVWHWQHHKGTTADDFDSGLREMIARIQTIGARVILCTPSVIGEKTYGSNPYDSMLDEYAHISRNIAYETASQLLDLRIAFTDYLKEHNPHNIEQGILTSDGVHLNKNGNRFLSTLVLQSFNISPLTKQV